MLYLLLFSAFLAILFLIIGLYVVLFGRTSQIKERLRLVSSPEAGTIDSENTREMGQNRGDSFLTGLSRVGFINKIYEKNKINLAQAHLPLRPEELFGTSVLVSGTIGVLLYFVSGNLVLVVFAILISYRLPAVFVAMTKTNRAKKLNDQLPEALSILSNGLRAGLSFTQSMLVAGKEMEDPIAQELNKVVRDNSLGKPIDEALSDFSRRNDDEDIDIFVTAILIQRQVGGNLSEILDILATTIRDRIKLKGDIKTITAQSKMSAVVIGSIPFALALILNFMNPEFIKPLFNTFLGNIMIGIVLFMQTIGVIVLVKIIKVKM